MHRLNIIRSNLLHHLIPARLRLHSLLLQVLIQARSSRYSQRFPHLSGQGQVRLLIRILLSLHRLQSRRPNRSNLLSTRHLSLLNRQHLHLRLTHLLTRMIQSSHSPSPICLIWKIRSTSSEFPQDPWSRRESLLLRRSLVRTDHRAVNLKWNQLN